MNATLNATATLLLLSGYFFIRRKKVTAHRTAMVAALLASTLFLTSYLYYHYHVGSVPFTGQGWIRPVYFAILITHIVLAVLIVPLALVTVTRAVRGDLERHRRIARITLPLWLYVSATGVVIYFMLYGF
ncbi:MAG: DUF420 domain-containing protein [Acidobacteria bacterium]|nr:DUF420 domain-containing protein [Acidobacteriota bacterium]